jgi:2,4-dienoyl-CoA reductase-like NADH-dependent reductase (Old Yellow Enzyme family)
MMDSTFQKLFTPGYIGKLGIPNRIVMPPMGTGYGHLDGSVSQREMDYYTARARGGAGLIIITATKVERLMEPSSFALGSHFGAIDSDSLIAALADLAEAVHDYGAKIALQLTSAFGQNASVFTPEKVPPVSASAIPVIMNPAVICRPLTIEEIHFIVEAFGMAARRAMMAGFDMVELHGHAGYLIDQFISRLWNKREDEYGGDLDGRMRFPVEIIASIRKNTGPDLPISFRLSVEHGIPGGRDTEESQEIARRLEGAGVDVIHASAGCYENFDLSLPSTYMPDACLSGMASAIKEAVHIPVIAVGKITPENGEDLLENGRADFIATGRALVADPDWPQKVRTNRRQDVRPCIRCNEYCTRLFSLKTMSCTVNPCVGKERYYKIEKTETPKHVLVIGGGPAGMEAARVAKLRGHEVILVEKATVLGGQLPAAASPPFKKELRHLIQWWERQLNQLGVDIRLNVEASPEMVAQMAPDAVVVATGARPVIPDIPGIQGDNVIGVVDYHLGRKPVGERIVVAGGGMAGCDAALELAQQGKQVTILEMLPQAAGDVNMVNRGTLLRLLTEWGVKIRVNSLLSQR